MGSGLFTLQEPPGRRRTEFGGQKSEAGSQKMASDFVLASVVDEAKLVFWRTKIEGRNGARRFRFLVSDFRPPARGARLGDKSNQVERAISTGQLHASLRFHIRPIDVVVFHGSLGRTGFEAGFPLRCLQRLSIPYIATLHCGWRHNRSTRDTFTPVLSY
jgi:hypothetical protein